MDSNFASRGFTDILNVSFNDELENLQKLIYEFTKKYNILSFRGDEPDVLKRFYDTALL